MLKSIIACVISSAIVGWYAYDYGRDSSSLKVAVLEKEITEKYNVQVTKLLEEQQILRKTVQTITTEKENEIKNINKRHSIIVDSLRDRQARPSVAPSESGSTEVTTIDSTGTGSTGQQLFREDAEFLIRQAQLADVLRASLLSCRRYLLELSE